MEVKTICRDCVFSIKSNGLQIGCALNRIDKFKDHGGQIEYNTDYYSIKDRFCNACRNTKWKNENKLQTMEEMIKKVTEEFKLSYDVILDIDSDDVFDLENSLDSINKQEIKPRQVICLMNQKWLPSKLINILNQYGISWKIKSFAVVNDLSYEDKLDMCIKDSLGTYYVMINQGIRLDQKFVNKMNELINQNMERVVVFNNINYSFISVEAHALVQTLNKEEANIVTKINQMMENNSCQTLIQNYH